MARTNHLKNAIVAQSKYKAAMKQMNEFYAEMEKALGIALVAVTTAHDAATICLMTKDKGLQKLAWTKAVVLLGTSSANLDDLLLIMKGPFRSTQKERELEEHLSAKENEIFQKLSIEQWFAVYNLAQSHSSLRGRVRNGVEKLMQACDSLTQLQEWKNTYGTREDYGRAFFSESEYRRSLDRLSPKVEEDP